MSRPHPPMRCLTYILLLLLAAGSAASSATAADHAPRHLSDWPQVPPVASYEITVTLDPQTHTLTGHEVITYHNRSDEALPYLVFHLYLNAFRSADTTFMRESHRQAPQHPGWTEIDRLTLAGQVDLLPMTTIDETLMTTTLPQPLLPGEALTLTLDFHALLPKVIARTGFCDDVHLVGQWFPKLSVYRQGRGWNAYQFHANSEFFADFGTYDVAITVPGDQVIAATGLPAGRKAHPDGTVTHQYHAEAVIDFVWAAWPCFQESHRQVGPTEVVLVYPPEQEHAAGRYLDVAEHALTHYGAWYGPYPYPRLSVVVVPGGSLGAGGMEYPTLVMIDAMAMGIPDVMDNRFLEFVTAHEIAHQWWQSTVATNEFEEPWLDEGLAEYSGSRLVDLAYGPGQPLLRLGTLSFSPQEMDRLEYLAINPAVPMAGRAWDFAGMNYMVATYAKPSTSYTTMERMLGEERWLDVLRTYYQRYQFKHPTGEDWLEVVNQVGGEEARSLLEQLAYDDGLVDYAVSDLSCIQEGGLHHCAVTISRLGEVVLPVEVEITFADGAQIRETWDGRDREQVYRYDKAYPVTVAEVDPDHALYLDVSFYNNSLTGPVQVEPIARISSQWFYLFEQLILIIGGLW